VADWNIYLAEDDLYTLTTLSLVQEVGETRYKQHALLADFAAEKLGDNDEANGRMARYFLQFAQENQEIFEALDPEWENLLAAVQVAHQERAWQLVLDLTAALGRSWFRYGRYHDANTAYALAETAAQQLDSDEDLAHILLNWAEVGIEQSNYDDAWGWLETALDLFYKLENGFGIAKSKYFQGFILYDQGQYQEAEKALLESKKLYETVKAATDQALTIENLARLYFAIDTTPDRAQSLADQALYLQENEKNDLGRVSVLRFLSNIRIRQGELDEAERFALMSASVSASLNNPAERCATNYLLLTIYRLQKNHLLAEELAIKTIELCRVLGNRKLEAMILHELSVNNLATGKIEQAKTIIEQSLTIYREIEDRLGYGYALRQLGDIYATMNKPELGLQAWREARQIAEYLAHQHLISQLQERISG
ncbi:MAG: tetratricopeptide repeat protein, partial [Anaerolineales bacterium]|nr:tetratricopeptide repeat protein [Anaerolineales bacterium]